MSKKNSTENRGRKPKKSISQIIASKGSDWRFNFNININQLAVITHRWDLDIIDIAIFEAIVKFISTDHEKLIKEIDGKGNVWYFVSENKILNDLPLLPFDKPSAVYKRIKKLEDYGLIERNPNNISSGKKHIRIGKNAEFYFNCKKI